MADPEGEAPHTGDLDSSEQLFLRAVSGVRARESAVAARRQELDAEREALDRETREFNERRYSE